MSVITWLLAICWILLWVAVVVDVLRRPSSAGRKAAWILIALIFPLLGPLVYAVLRKPTGAEAEQRFAAQRELGRHSPYDRTGTR